MPQGKVQPVTMKGMRIIFRNFEGKESEFNQAGARNFGVILPPDVAEAMLADGWNVKTLKPSDEEVEEGIKAGPPWLPIKVRFDKGRPPMIMKITESTNNMTRMTEEDIDQLDWVDIAVEEETQQPKVDLIVRPYFYEVRGQTGIAAYLQEMYITVEENELALKYANLKKQ